MADKKNKELKGLKLLYLGIIIISAILILPTHIFPPPLFMPVRFPHYLEMMGPFLGISWPMSFAIYHYALYSLVIVGSLNALGILFYPKLRYASLFSSFVGMFLFFLMILFFFFVFLNVNAITAVIYGLYSAVLLIVNIITFKALIRR